MISAFQRKRCVGVVRCVQCPPGHYIDRDTVQCVRCPANTVAHGESPHGVDSCIACGEGMHAVDNVRCASSCHYTSPGGRKYDFTNLAR